MEPTGLAKPGETRGLMGTGSGLARQESAGRVFGRVWNRTDSSLQSTPGPLAGYPYPLLTLDGSDCDKCGSTSERWRELWVHLGVSPNQRGNHNQTLGGAWVLMDIHSDNCRRYLRLFGCTWAINFPQQRIWYMDFCSLSLLNHTGHHLLQHHILCLAILRKRKKKVRDSNIHRKTLK